MSGLHVRGYRQLDAFYYWILDWWSRIKRAWTEFVLCNMHISCANTITIYYKVSYPSRFYIKLFPLLLWGGNKGEFKITIADHYTDRESDFLGTATIHNPHPHPTHMHLHLPIKKKWTFFQNVLNYNRYFPTCISSRKAKSIPKYVRNSCRSQKNQFAIRLGTIGLYCGSIT